MFFYKVDTDGVSMVRVIIMMIYDINMNTGFVVAEVQPSASSVEKDEYQPDKDQPKDADIFKAYATTEGRLTKHYQKIRVQTQL